MRDLRDWLRRNKLEQYGDLFEANDIDLDILAELSDGDLEQLGLSLGNRRRLLKAIAGRGAEAAQLKPSSPEGAGLDDAQRRQVAASRGGGGGEGWRISCARGYVGVCVRGHLD